MRIPSSKFATPNLPPGFTSRPHLLDTLDGVGADQLVVVIAPPGFGKTALLTDWLRRPGGPPSAWVTLDAADNAPRLRSALLAALLALPGLPADSPLREFDHGRGDRAVFDVLDELAATSGPAHPVIRVVLDDVHELTDAEALRDLARLIRRKPAGLRLVLSGRMDPPLPLPRMRLEGRLRELRAEDLRFTVDDSAALLHASGIRITPEQVEILHARTGGWAAGLRLAALALRRQDDPEDFIAQFSGSESSVADYLTDEVMAGLSEEARQLLRVSAACSQLPAGLAVALSGHADAERMLDELTRVTALVELTEPGTYRIHTLLRTYLGTELERHFPGLHHRSHVIAARWWLAADEPEHALRHAELSGDSELLLGLLRDSGLRLVAAGRLAAVRRALDACGPASRATDPWSTLLAALVHHAENARSDALEALAEAGRLWPPDPEPALDVLRTSVERLFTGRAPAGTSTGPPPSVPPELETLRRLGDAAAAAWASGAHAGEAEAGGRARFEDAAAFAREHGFPYFEVRALTCLAVLEAARGGYREMTAAATAAVDVAEGTGEGGRAAEWTAGPTTLIAYGDLLACDPASALAHADAVLAAGTRLAPETDVTVRVVHRVAAGDLGPHARGPAPFQPPMAGEAVRTPSLLAALALLEYQAALAQSGPWLATETAARLERRVGKVGEGLLMDAWAHLHAGHPDAARAAVEPLADGSRATLVPYTPVEVHLVRAEAALRRGDPAAGRVELTAALARASVLGVVRPFVQAGGMTREMLVAGPLPGVSAQFAQRVAAALSAAHADVPTALSERELAVLTLLPSLLSAREIAEELTVSVNTVKSHIRSIYAKLGVSTRRDAVRRARERDVFR